MPAEVLPFVSIFSCIILSIAEDLLDLKKSENRYNVRRDSVIYAFSIAQNTQYRKAHQIPFFKFL